MLCHGCLSPILLPDAQLMGRLIAPSSRSTTLNAWLTDQRAELAAAREVEPAPAKRGSTSQALLRSVNQDPSKRGQPANVRNLVPLTASLTQVHANPLGARFVHPSSFPHFCSSSVHLVSESRASTALATGS